MKLLYGSHSLNSKQIRKEFGKNEVKKWSLVVFKLFF